MQQISLAITTYNRLEQTLNSFDKLYSDERINEIVILDDFSDVDIYKKLENILKYYPKVRLYRNRSNLGCYFNKNKVIERCKNPYVIILDSDNVIGVDYLDKIYEEQWSEHTILAPDFAKETFDYREFAGVTITKENVASYMNRPMFSTALNTFNFFINRQRYLDTFDNSFDPITADSIYFNFCWLRNGNKIKFVEGLQYMHEIHSGSHYKNNVHLTPSGLYEKIEKDFLELK